MTLETKTDEEKVFEPVVLLSKSDCNDSFTTDFQIIVTNHNGSTIPQVQKETIKTSDRTSK